MKNLLERRLQTALILVVVILSFQCLAFAAEGGEKKSDDKKTEPDLNVLIERLERAEARTKAAREAASAAQQRAVELERQVDSVGNRLTKAKEDLKQYGSQSAPSSDGSTLPQDEPQTQQDAAEAVQPDTIDSLTERITLLEEDDENQRGRFTEFGQTRLETDQKFYVQLFGTLLFNTYYNTAGTFDVPTGLYVFSEFNRTLDNGSNFGASIRQTLLGFAFQAPKVGDWKLSGDLQLDFFGGNPNVYNGRAFSLLRLRVARARVESGRFALVVGQDDPIISPLNPTSLAQVGFPALAESGNLWAWTPQVKAAYQLVSRQRERLTLEGGIMAPYSGAIGREFEFETVPDAGERGRFPVFEARLSYQRGDLRAAPTNSYLIFDKQPFQVSIGGHYGRFLAAPGRIVNSAAVAGDYVIPIGDKVTLSGELFWGRSLSGLGGGIVQGIAVTSTDVRGIRTRGGWAQLQVRPLTKLALNFAYGSDDPYNKDLLGTRFERVASDGTTPPTMRGTSRASNRTVSANFLYRFRSNFIISTEYRFIQTLFTEAATRHNNHINIGFGYLF